MIRNLVFDLGNVLIDFLPRKLAALEQVPAPDTDCFVREVFGGVEWVRLDRGTLPPEEATSSVCARLPSSLHPAARNLIFHWWSHPFSPVAGMGDLLQEAKRLGYGIFLLSNATRALHDYLPRVPGADCLDGCIVSADWQLLKPQPEIYLRLYETYSLHPEECLFVDDSPANIEGALRTGMPGIVFHGDISRLRRELNAYGVPVRPL